jgi:hypothetical protein
MMPVSERIDWSVSSVPRRVAVTVTVTQFYLVASYLLAGLVPYFWRDASYASLSDGPVPEWVLVVPAALFLVPGFWIVAFDTTFGLLLAMAGLLTLTAYRRWLTVRARNWLLAAATLSLGFAVFALTPTADAIRTWVLD